MKTSDAIFQLVKSLTKDEKRFFKLFSESIGENKNYLKLFIEMEKQKEYNEEYITKKYKGENFAKNISTTKNYLGKAIVRALNNYHYKAEETDLLHQLIAIHLLKNKKNNSLLKKTIAHAKNIAKSKDRKLVQSLLINQEIAFLRQNSFNYDTPAKTAILYQEKKQLLEDTIKGDELDQISYEITYNIRYGIKTTKERLLEITLLHIFSDNSIVSFPIKNKQLSTRALVYYELDDFENVKTSFNELITLYEKTEMIKNGNDSNFLFNYLISIRNTIIASLNTADLKSIPKLLKKLIDYKHHSSPLIASLSSISYHVSSLEYFIASFQLSKALKQLSVIEKEVLNKKKELVISKSYQLELEYLTAITFFMTGDYKETLKHIAIITTKFANLEIDKQIIRSANILQLLCYFESNKLELIPYKIRSMIRDDVKRKKTLKYELALFNFFNQVSKSPITQKESLLTLKKELEKLRVFPEERLAIQRLQLLKWIQAKVERKSLMHYNTTISA